MKKKINLIICKTPLQVLIAEKIIDLYPNERFYGVMFPSVVNEKIEFYATRLKKKCNKFVFINNKVKLFIILLFFKFINISLNNVFVASIDCILPQLIISKNTFKKLLTFDDGTANIVGSGYFYNEKIGSKKVRFLKKIFKINKTMQDLKKISTKHYTIYNEMPNIIDNTEFISLLPTDFSINKSIKKIKIFLGQPIFELKDGLSYEEKKNKNKKYTSKVIEEIGIDYYFPHPKEQYHIDNVDYIYSKFIFEDWILEQIRLNPTIKYEVYSFFSSVIFNIKDIPNVSVYSIKFNFDKWLNKEYELVNKFNIDIIDSF